MNPNNQTNAFYQSITPDTQLIGLAISGNQSYNAQTSNGTSATCWHYWQDYYYPNQIIHSYPVYIQDRSKDLGKQAFEIIKALQDKKLIKLDKVADFIEAMDTLIKIL